MTTIIIGIILIIIGSIFVNVGFPEFKEELRMVDEQPLFKRIFIYIIEFIGLLNFDSYLGWLLGLGILFIFCGGAFILLTFFWFDNLYITVLEALNT